MKLMHMHTCEKYNNKSRTAKLRQTDKWPHAKYQNAFHATRTKEIKDIINNTADPSNKMITTQDTTYK
jgi:hypothetical protein